jgi:hypothetical protein
MFRGGPVDSYGTGIASGLASGGRVGLYRGGSLSYNPFQQSQTSNLLGRNAPKILPGMQGADIFAPVQITGSGFSKYDPGKSIRESQPMYEEFAEVSEEMPSDNIIASADKTFVPQSIIDKSSADVELGLPTSKVEDLTTEKVVEKVKDGDDEVEVTMTDLEKALGLDKARRRDLGDMLGRASAAFLGAGDVREGLAEFMAAETKAGPSRTERIKSIAGLEEFKAKKAKELYESKLKNQQYAPGNAQKNYEFFIKQGIDKDQALNLAMGKSRNFDEAFLTLSAKGTVTAKLFDTLARQEGIDPLPQVDIETLEVGETFYVPGAKSLVRIVLKEGKKDLIQTPY